MMSLLWTLSATVRAYSHACLPSNRAVDWLHTPLRLKWAAPVALAVAPTYLFCASVCASAVNRGGPGYLNVLVLLFFWNAVKFAAMGALAPIKGKATHVREVRVRPVARLRAGSERALAGSRSQSAAWSGRIH